MAELNRSVSQNYKAFCAACGQQTNHTVRASMDDSGDDEDSGIYWEEHHQIIQCLGCDTISFCHLSENSEDQHPIGPDEWTDGKTYHLYPVRSEKIRKIKTYYTAPPVLRRVYRETVDCFNNENFTLCAGGVRAAIEGLCAVNSVFDGPVTIKKPDGTTIIRRKKDLQGKIAGLYEKHILTQPHSEVLHEHRFLGNDALHELTPPSAEELALAIDIIETTFDALYELPEKGEEIKENRIRRATAKARKTVPRVYVPVKTILRPSSSPSINKKS